MSLPLGPRRSNNAQQSRSCAVQYARWMRGKRWSVTLSSVRVQGQRRRVQSTRGAENEGIATFGDPLGAHSLFGLREVVTFATRHDPRVPCGHASHRGRTDCRQTSAKPEHLRIATSSDAVSGQLTAGGAHFCREWLVKPRPASRCSLTTTLLREHSDLRAGSLQATRGEPQDAFRCRFMRSSRD